MGKQYGMKHETAFDEKQRGFVWRLVQALNYHRWQPNRKKMIKDHQKQSQKVIARRDEVEVKELLEEKETLFLKTQRPRKKRSLRARIKALIVGEKSPDLRRTYSIHHLEDSEDGLGKKRIILLPNSDKEISSARKSYEPNDVLEMFKVDKALLIKHLQDADEALGLGLNPRAKLGKSRSFPSQRRKLKPVKLEDKKVEVWTKPLKEDVVESLEGLSSVKIEPTHKRSSSLKESLDKYTNLYHKSFSNEPKLGQSKSLRVGASESENQVPTYFRRLRSMSNFDSIYSSVNFEVVLDEFSKITAKELSSALGYVHEEDEEIENSNMDANESADITEIVMTTSAEDGDDDVEKAQTLGSDILSLNLMESHDEDLQITEGFEHVTDEPIVRQEADNKESLTKKGKNSDSNYTRLLLDHSGIALDAPNRTWHSYDQPLSPRLFEEVEALYYPEEQQDSSLWNHQMLFDLANEKLVEIYDVSLPYYPKALSKNCHVRPFPKGNRIVEEVLKSVGRLLTDQERSMDGVVARDFENDYRWMNLQMESERKALEVEDVIFEELVEEIVCSLR